jgi:5'-nucleotidase
MGKANRIYLKFEGLDWDDDQAIDEFAAALHGSLVDRLDVDKEFRSQEQDENEGA